MTRHIGIYPGTFDPIHQGHLAFCLEVIKRGEVDEIVLLPEALPRGKPGASPIMTRLALLNEAVAAFPSLNAISLASERFTTRQTLPELRGYFGDAELSLLIGSDLVSSLHLWDELETLLEAMSLVIGMREADTRRSVNGMLKRLGQTRQLTVRYSLIETAYADVASSHIRSGKMVADLLTLR
jgi:nicotinate-nucleotide adenylyltransferase